MHSSPFHTQTQQSLSPCYNTSRKHREDREIFFYVYIRYTLLDCHFVTILVLNFNESPCKTHFTYLFFFLNMQIYRIRPKKMQTYIYQTQKEFLFYIIYCVHRIQSGEVRTQGVIYHVTFLWTNEQVTISLKNTIIH